MHIEFLVEEPSAEIFLSVFLPSILGDTHTFQIASFNGKKQLLQKLPRRLTGYVEWIDTSYRIVVLVDEDRADCHLLKLQMEMAAQQAGLMTRTTLAQGGVIQVVNRIIIEELEAWYFGDMEALHTAYPRLPQRLENRAEFRDPDRIGGGTWETLEKLLQAHGYFKGGLSKLQLAKEVAPYIRPERNRSRSFQTFYSALLDLLKS